MSDDLHLDALAQMAGDDLEWEVLLVRFGNGCPVAPGSHIQDEHIPGEPLGPVAAIRAALTDMFPEIEWRYPDHGYLTRDALRLDFNVHLEATPLDVMLLVKGEGDPFPLVTVVCRRQGWTAIDLTTWRVLDLDNPSHEGWDRTKDAIARNRGKQPWFRR